MEVIWFRHWHENRNDWFNFGLIELHYSKKIKLKELKLEDALKYGFHPSIIGHKDLKGKSFLLFINGKQRTKCIIDCEDSFIHISDLIENVDIYFISAYNEDLFDRKTYPKFYNWQTPEQIIEYKKIIEEKIINIGSHFHKIKKFIPIAPTITVSEKHAPLFQKYINFKNRISLWFGGGYSFKHRYKLYIKRYNELLLLRNSNLQFDIVLNDSLWGWPVHRISLHKELDRLHKLGYNIHSRLAFTKASFLDGSNKLNIVESEFPMITKDIVGNYEVAISKSKLAVFACGFHWGWRNIVMLAIMLGIPVASDRLLVEPYFDMKEFKLWEIESENWTPIQHILNSYNEDMWMNYKQVNQNLFDKYMRPDIVASYVINVIKTL